MQAFINFLVDRFNEEPVIFYQLVNAVIILGISFGLTLTEQQTGAILVVVALIIGILTRQKVTPNVRVS